MKTSVAWLTTAQAAAHLGFVKSDGSPNVGAFKAWKCRTKQKPRQYWLGGRLRFRVVDLDRCVEAEPEQGSALHLVGAAR